LSKERRYSQKKLHQLFFSFSDAKGAYIRL